MWKRSMLGLIVLAVPMTQVIQVAQAVPAGGPTGGVAGGLAGGGAMPAPADDCIPPDVRTAQNALADINASAFLGGAKLMPRGPVATFAFFPQGGNIYSDIFHVNYVDLDPGPGIRDWDCGNATYNGHLGHDVDLRSFAEQRIGMPVFAALDGVVVSLDDGHPDESTTLTNKPANFVILDHSAIEPGLRTWYWHLRNGSVDVELGQQVSAGEQLGLAASSGYSSGPHLHFEVQTGGDATETMVGPCRPAGQSRWDEQWQIRDDHYFRDFGFARGQVTGTINPPHPYPRDRAVTFSDTIVSYWFQGHNLPANSTWRMRFFRPNGTLGFDSGTGSFGFSTEDLRWYWASFWWNIPAMRSVAGDWTLRIDINGEPALVTPLTVLASNDPTFNRAPAPVAGAFDPETPGPNDVIFFRLEQDLLLDDPDHDVVSYRYEWLLDGQVVRDVVSAGHADAIPAIATLGGGTELTVRVTPNDGDADGPTTTASLSLAAPCPADLTGDGLLNNTDINAFVSAFLSQQPLADMNDDGLYNNTDINLFVSAFLAGCN